MPLYFAVSGFFFKAYEPKVFFIKKINNILVPLVFWLMVWDIWRIWGALRYTQYGSMVDFTIVQFLKDPLCHDILCNGALWFLICLFITNVMFYFISVAFKDNLKRCITVLFLASIGCILSANNIKLPLWIDSSLIALPFFFLGYCCKDVPYFKPNYSPKKSLFLGIGFIVISYTIYYTFGYTYTFIEIVINSFQGSFILCYLNSITYVLGLLLLCKVVNWLPIVSYFGRYSIIVLCIHMPLIFFIPGFIERRSGYQINVWELTAIIFLICWLTIPICKRFLPYFVAQKPLFKIPQQN